MQTLRRQSLFHQLLDRARALTDDELEALAFSLPVPARKSAQRREDAAQLDMFDLVAKGNVQVAAQWLFDNPTGTYGEAIAQCPAVTLHQLRGYVNYRWGSLSDARSMTEEEREFYAHSVNYEKSAREWTRPCSNCGCTKPRPHGQYRCDPCKSGEHKVYEGIV